MIGFSLYKFGCQTVPVSNRPLYLANTSMNADSGIADVVCSRNSSYCLFVLQPFSAPEDITVA